MSVTSIGSNASQTIGSLLLQQLAATGASSQAATSGGDGLGDLLTLSPAAQQLAQAPAAVTQALTDLLTTQKDVSGDLAQLKGYFQQHPESLASLLSGLQGSASTSAASSAQGRNLLLTALMNGQSNASDPTSLLTLLGGTGQASLFDLLGGAGTGSSSDSLLG